MANYQLAFRYEPSTVEDSLISLWVNLDLYETRMNYNLDVDAFFVSLGSDGYYPLFTCECGTFGCGGYYVEVHHDHDGINLINAYAPLSQLDPDEIINEFHYHLDWEDVLALGEEIIGIMNEISAKAADRRICCGAYGNDIAGKIDEYQAICTTIRNRQRSFS